MRNGKYRERREEVKRSEALSFLSLPYTIKRGSGVVGFKKDMPLTYDVLVVVSALLQ